MTLFVIILVLLLLISIYVNINLYLKLKATKSYIESKIYIEDDMYNFYKDLLKLFNGAYANISRVDRKGLFSSDDEVGFTFKSILLIINSLAEKLKTIQLNDDDIQTTPKEESSSKKEKA